MLQFISRLMILGLCCAVGLLMLMSYAGRFRNARHLLIYFQREAYLLDAHSGIAVAYQSNIAPHDDNPLLSPDGRWQLEGIRNAALGKTTLYLSDQQLATTTTLGAYSVIPLNPLGIIWLADDTVWILALEFNSPRTDTVLLHFDLESATLIKEYRYTRLSPLSWMPSPNDDYLMLMGQQRVFPYQQTFVIDLRTGDDVLGGLDIFAPRWSPDGNWLFYEIEANGQRTARWVNFINGRTLTTPKNGLRTLFVGWSPDSRWTAYENVVDGVAGVSIMNLETGLNHVVLASPHDLLLRWSPHSNHLLIIEQMQQSTRLWVSQTDHTQPILIDTITASVAGARWSSDENMLVYHIRQNEDSIVRVYDLVTQTKHDVLHSERVFRVEWLESQQCSDC